MSGFTVFAIAMVACAVVGFVFQKNGEMAGLGRPAKRGGLRAPHGRLVRTKRLDGFEEVSFATKFARVGALCFPVTILVLVTGALGFVDLAGIAPASVDALAVVGIACGLTQADVGVVRSLAYALFGYVAAGVIATCVGLFVVPLFVEFGVAGINALTMVLGTLGASVAVSAMPLVRTYAREFEDGHVNSIQVTSISAAARAFERLADPGWTPPADRVQSVQKGGEHGFLRSSMQRRREKAERGR